MFYSVCSIQYNESILINIYLKIKLVKLILNENEISEISDRSKGFFGESLDSN